MNPEIVPATPEILLAFYGRPLKRTARAWAALLQGEPICIGGYYQDGERTIAFSDFRPIMREKFTKTAVKMALMVMDELRQEGVTVHAGADCAVEAAGRFLEYLGFHHVEKGVYLCPASRP